MVKSHGGTQHSDQKVGDLILSSSLTRGKLWGKLSDPSEPQLSHFKLGIIAPALPNLTRDVMILNEAMFIKAV